MDYFISWEHINDIGGVPEKGLHINNFGSFLKLYTDIWWCPKLRFWFIRSPYDVIYVLQFSHIENNVEHWFIMNMEDATPVPLTWREKIYVLIDKLLSSYYTKDPDSEWPPYIQIYIFIWTEDVLYLAWEKGIVTALKYSFVLTFLFIYIIIILFCVLSAATLTWEERTGMAVIQERQGPSRAGVSGFFQALADAFKLMFKEFIYPRWVKKSFYALCSVLSFVFAYIFWVVIPYMGELNISNTHFSLLLIVYASLLHTYAILVAGWSSNSKYSFLGGIRTVCQLISYDIVVIFLFFIISLSDKNYDLLVISKDQASVGIAIAVMPSSSTQFSLMFLAEAGRHPFDLPEAEAELVSGYNVEYSSINFALFFLAEYSTVVFSAVLFMICFLNPETSTFVFFIESLKLMFTIFWTVYLRALIPRYRYDQLMRSCWKGHIPFACVNFLMTLVFDNLL